MRYSKMVARAFIQLIITTVLIVLVKNSVAEVIISDDLRYEAVNEYVEIRAGSYTRIPISILQRGDKLLVSARARNAIFDGISVFICSEKGLALFQNRQPSDCQGVTRKKGNIRFQFIAGAESFYYLVADNSFSLLIKKKIDVVVTVEQHFSPNDKSKLRQQFLKLQTNIRETFRAPKFDIRIEPCGQPNAFSNSARGDITLCTELLFDLYSERLDGAVAAIFLHELGHTLLNVWKLPNWDNEETVDEFSLVLLFLDSQQQKALDWIKYYKQHDSRAQAKYILQQDDRHPLSIQRIRNIERILRNPRPVISRWNRVLYQHMTRSKLRRIISNPGPYDDATLAKAALRRL